MRPRTGKDRRKRLTGKTIDRHFGFAVAGTRTEYTVDPILLQQTDEAEAVLERDRPASSA